MKITLEQFEKLIEAFRSDERAFDTLKNVGINLIDFKIYVDKILILLECVFNPEQLDYFEWWLFDVPNGIEGDPDPRKQYVWDKDKNPIDVSTVPALYKFLETLEEPCDKLEGK